MQNLRVVWTMFRDLILLGLHESKGKCIYWVKTVIEFPNRPFERTEKAFCLVINKSSL